MSANEQREFDLVIFGASGFAGLFAVRELLLSISQNPDEYSSLKFAVAGRNESKILDTLAKVGKELGKDLSGVPIVHADVTDQPSLVNMAKRTQVILNLVGPYILYGGQVVDACVQCGTHHLDLSAEPQYIEGAQLKHYKEAVNQKALIISTCGFDCIPTDMGVQFLKRHFNGRVHSVESFAAIQPGPSGYMLNFGTLASIMQVVANLRQVISLRRRLYDEVLTEKLPPSLRKLGLRVLPFREDPMEGWNVIFPSTDREVVDRTQSYNYQHFREPPVQFYAYFTVPSISSLLISALTGAQIGLFSLFSLGRKFVQAYPSLFPFGEIRFSHEGPTRKQIDESRFHVILKAKGWSGIKDSDPEPDKPFDKTMMVKVSGPEPGYLATCGYLVQCGLTVLKDRDQMPPGGVLTPASAFRNTKLLERLEKRDLHFQVIS